MTQNPTTRRGMILPADLHAITQAAAILREGGLVSFPTETVYGLGANALSGEAVAKIYEAKGRPRFDPLIVHVAEAAAAWKLATNVPDIAKRLAAAFWPGPMTLVLQRKAEPAANGPVVAELLTAGLGTVGLRVPDHPVARQLIQAAGVPISAPSANRFGSISPTRAEHVAEELGERVDVILDGGPCRTGVESTVISLVGDDAEYPRILRLGGLAREQIERVIGPVMLAQATSRPGNPESQTSAASRQPFNEAHETTGRPSPGMLDRHYAPRTPLRLMDSLDAAIEAGASHHRVGLLIFGSMNGASAKRFAVIESLSSAGDLREAAANLFAAMRRLDHAGLDQIIAHRVPAEGLGLAINDRLERAAAK